MTIDVDAILALARAALADAERVQPAPWVEHERDFGNIIDDNGFHVCRTVALNDGNDHECEVICARSTREPALAAALVGLVAFGEKVNAIRNDIVGRQTISFSAHVYPLVAALNEAGFVGEGYEVARAKARTLINERDAAIARAEKAEAELARDRAFAEAREDGDDEPERCSVYFEGTGRCRGLVDVPGGVCGSCAATGRHAGDRV